jgi:Ca-activated chloride channel family protein
MKKQKYESKVFSDYEDRFQYFIAAALFLLILDVFVSDKRSKWAGKFNIFDTKTASNE